MAHKKNEIKDEHKVVNTLPVLFLASEETAGQCKHLFCTRWGGEGGGARKKARREGVEKEVSPCKSKDGIPVNLKYRVGHCNPNALFSFC